MNTPQIFSHAQTPDSGDPHSSPGNKNKEHQMGSDIAHHFHSNAASSRDSFISFESDRWSQRGISSRVSINFGDPQQSEDDEARLKKCLWAHKIWGNFILPGFFGIESRRIVRKLSDKHPISTQLLNNVDIYNNIIRSFFKNELLQDMKELATKMYFPTGQVEADGLSIISAEIWAATYLLLCIHDKLREADFHLIRSTYSSLAWDSGQAYRATLKFHQIYFEFREHIVPLWRNIERLVGICENNDFVLAEHPETVQGHLSLTKKSSSKSGKSVRKSRPVVPPPPLPDLRICEDLALITTLQLRVVPEMKSAIVQSDVIDKDFNDLEYGRQLEIIKGLLGKPAATIQNAFTILKKIQLKLLNDGAALPRSENDMSCSRAMKILIATLKLLYKEVKLSPAARFEISESIRATSEDVNSLLAYTEWVLSKTSEFHSMLRLCYNFALLCLDMDLPRFEKVLSEQNLCEQVFKPTARSFGRCKARLKDKQFEYKVMSLTKLMMEASTTVPFVRKQGDIDEDFEWEHFYKTDYHLVLQRLPLRMGNFLLQFSAVTEDKLLLRRKISSATPNLSADESLPNAARRFYSIYRKEDSLLVSECGSFVNPQGGLFPIRELVE